MGSIDIASSVLTLVDSQQKALRRNVSLAEENVRLRRWLAVTGVMNIACGLVFIAALIL